MSSKSQLLFFMQTVIHQACADLWPLSKVKCKICGGEFETSSGNAKRCANCRKEHDNKRYKRSDDRRSKRLKLEKGERGIN